MQWPRWWVNRRRTLRGLHSGDIVGHAAVYWCVYHVVLWHAVFLCRVIEYRREIVSGGRPVSFGALYDSFLRDHRLFLWCAIALLPVVLWDLLRRTQRVIGPMKRVEAAVLAMSRGETIAPLATRSDDRNADFMKHFNALVAVWNEKLAAERERVRPAWTDDATAILSEIESLQREPSASRQESRERQSTHS